MVRGPARWVAQAGVVALAACGSAPSVSSTTTSSAGSHRPPPEPGPQDKAGAAQVVTMVFASFFDATNPDPSQRLALLEAPGDHASAFYAWATSPLTRANPTEARILQVSFPAEPACRELVARPGCARVAFELVSANGGQATSATQTGYAVFVGGKWLVSSRTFCQVAADRPAC